VLQVLALVIKTSFVSLKCFSVLIFSFANWPIATSLGIPLTSTGGSRTGASTIDDEDYTHSNYEPSVAGAELGKMVSHVGTATVEGDVDDDEDYGDDASSHEIQPTNKDAFNITAQSAKLQLDLLAQVSAALQAEKSRNPTMQISDPMAVQALSSYEAAVGNLKGLVGDLLRISRDRDAYWQYRLDREANVRRMWEESMARVAKEQEELESRIGESELKRRKTKRALREALGGFEMNESRPLSMEGRDNFVVAEELFEDRMTQIMTGFIGYEDPPRERLAMDADDRPKISLWVRLLSPDIFKLANEIHQSILKSMIGKDMTKMTLPVSFNEPTSLLQRVAEDMEYTDLLDTAAERMDSTERLLYVAAFAASEYASTMGRVAKPFNPLLGETYEYARPDKGYRFFIEQVSHHPPIGAAYAESKKWDYYVSSCQNIATFMLTACKGRICCEVEVLREVLRHQSSWNMVPAPQTKLMRL
jgi:oxysterol-binding protein 1